MEARLVYNKVRSGSEYDGANLVVRAYMQQSSFGNQALLYADVIYTENCRRVVKQFTNTNPTRLAEEVADFANDRMLASDVVYCSNDLPDHTRSQADIANRFKTAFCAEIEAITDEARRVREAREKDNERKDKIYAPYRDRKIEEAKQKIFGNK